MKFDWIVYCSFVMIVMSFQQGNQGFQLDDVLVEIVLLMSFLVIDGVFALIQGLIGGQGGVLSLICFQFWLCNQDLIGAERFIEVRLDCLLFSCYGCKEFLIGELGFQLDAVLVGICCFWYQ